MFVYWLNAAVCIVLCSICMLLKVRNRSLFKGMCSDRKCHDFWVMGPNQSTKCTNPSQSQGQLQRAQAICILSNRGAAFWEPVMKRNILKKYYFKWPYIGLKYSELTFPWSQSTRKAWPYTIFLQGYTSLKIDLSLIWVQNEFQSKQAQTFLFNFLLVDLVPDSEFTVMKLYPFLCKLIISSSVSQSN